MIIHIGYHKTGTTWLQKTVFDDPAIGFVQPWKRADVIARLVLAEPFRFHADAERAHFASAAAEAARAGRTPVMSVERLSGNPHSGGYDAETIAERLARTFPEARVLICVREQRGMIASVYQQYVREGGVSSLRRYLDPPSRGSARVPMFSFAHFAYDALVSRYIDLFGADRVLVLPYEWLRKDPLGFVGRIAAFAGAAPPVRLVEERRNPALSGLAVLVKRPLNLALVRDRLNPHAPFDSGYLATAARRGVDRADRLTPRPVRRWFAGRAEHTVTTAVGRRYAESNRRLGELLSIDLGALGYDV